AITLAATDLNLAGTVNSGAAVTTLANSVAGTPIDLGTNTAGSIGLTQGELNNIRAGTLRIGSPTAGAITISQPITLPNVSTIGSPSTLSLINNGPINEPGSSIVLLNVPNLRVSSTGPVSMGSGPLLVANTVSTLAAVVTGAGNTFEFHNSIGT